MIENAKLIDGVRSGRRRALAQAITLVESTRPDHREKAAMLLDALPVPDRVTRRIGLSGTPGVGKSTFIESLGMDLIEQDHKVAVLAVDPSSTRSGGSILGDKTRMHRLARAPGAFVRPQPSQNALGGVARRTREVIRLVEAAGFDTVLVETVGVGQSEIMVAEMTDIFVLLLAPAGGDELQGVKRGIMEIADLVVVNKADGALKPVAEATRAEYAGALRLLRRDSQDVAGFPQALCVSAQTGEGLGKVWQAIETLHHGRCANGWLARRRGEQAVSAMTRALEQGVLGMLRADETLASALPALADRVAAGALLPERAAQELLDLFAARHAGQKAR